MKFKNKTTGVILEPSVPMVEEMLKKNPNFTVYEEPSLEEPSKDEKEILEKVPDSKDEKDISEQASDSEPSEDAPTTKASSQKKPASEKKGSQKGE